LVLVLLVPAGVLAALFGIPGTAPIPLLAAIGTPADTAAAEVVDGIGAEEDVFIGVTNI
jgi:hypothetical protein